MSAGAQRTLAITAGNTDTRITAIGHRIRRYRLDELPQLLDVVFGRMAIIGPRPEDPRFIDDGPDWDRVLSIRPGIAGLTQILAGPWEAKNLSGPDADERYRNEAMPAKMAIDLWYVENASPRIDWIVVSSLALQYLADRQETPAHRLAASLIPQAELFLHEPH